MPLSTSSQLPKLVLIGGGHSHSVALANWRRFYPASFPFADITLITPQEKTVYSGSVPGYLAGLCDRQACELEVGALARSAGLKLVIDQVVGLDFSKQQVICQDHEPIDFDLASLNIGSTPRLPPGVVASDRIIPMKPMGEMLDRLEHYLANQHSANQPKTRISLAIVGGGLGGIEVALSLKARWGDGIDLALICRASIASAQNKSLQQFLRLELEHRSVKIYDHTAVEMVKENIHDVTLKLNSGQHYSCDVSLWATEATAPDWLQASGLTTDDRGFVTVDTALRSVSHESIFASGDIAAVSAAAQTAIFPKQTFPKAGVFAVRQGKTLSQNLVRSLMGKPLKQFKARSQYLSLISLGDRRAVASYGPVAVVQNHFQSLLWHWKRSIDGGFVDRFQCNL